MVSRHRTTIRLPEELAERAGAVARVLGVSLNEFFVEAIASEVDRVRATKAFSERARDARRRDKELLKRPAR